MDESSDREARLKPAEAQKVRRDERHGLKPVSDGRAG